MPRLVNAVPKYRKHRPSGQAVVTLHGRAFYLGLYGTKASRLEYDRLIAEWLASGRETPAPQTGPITVSELLARYWKFAQGHYRKGGEETSEVGEIKLALAPARRLYGRTPAAEFGPLALKAVRETMVADGLSRGVVNHRVSRIRRAFKWATGEELVPPSVYQGLAAVEGLKAGRTTAPDRPPVEPVDDVVVEETLSLLPPVVRDMVQFQRLTGCRPGEVCAVRPCDVEREGEVWRYRPASHKTQHRGKQRTVYIGPKAQAVLAPYLLRAANAACFSPAESERKRLVEVHARRKTPLSCGNRPGTNKSAKPGRKPGNRYTRNEYARAIRRSIDLENERRAKKGLAPLARWSPNQLRHAAATEIRKDYGLEGAQVILGHSRADVSQIYAARDERLAEEIARRIG